MNLLCIVAEMFCRSRDAELRLGLGRPATQVRKYKEG